MHGMLAQTASQREQAPVSESSPMSQPEPRIERGRGLFIAGMDLWFTDKTKGDIPALWDRFIPYFGHVPGQQGRVAYGVIHNMTTDGDGFDYMAGVEVSSIDGLPKELNHTHLEARTYAVFPHPGTLDELSQTMNFIFSDWLPSPAARSTSAPKARWTSSSATTKTSAPAIQATSRSGFQSKRRAIEPRCFEG
jgi:AraC family transcriptional regulator